MPSTQTFSRVSPCSAEARFAEVRNLAKYLLYDVYDRLERTPQTLAMRRDVARVAQGGQSVKWSFVQPDGGPKTPSAWTTTPRVVPIPRINT